MSAVRAAEPTTPVRWYRPPPSEAGSAGPTLLWLHGGGFIGGGLDLPEAHDVAQTLSQSGITVATAGYRLAPRPGLDWTAVYNSPRRGRFPLALDDVVDAYHEARASPGAVIIGGASAGACLAAAATLRATDEGSRPDGTVLAYGFFHAVHPRPQGAAQRSRRHRRITHATWALNLMNRNYAGSRRTLSDRLAFPGGHDLTSFPPTLVMNAEHDNMRASGDLFATELDAAGVDVQHVVVTGTSHAFLNRPRDRAFDTAVSMISAWCRAVPAAPPAVRP